jgi:hypothetical protein
VGNLWQCLPNPCSRRALFQIFEQSCHNLIRLWIVAKKGQLSHALLPHTGLLQWMLPRVRQYVRLYKATAQKNRPLKGGQNTH